MINANIKEPSLEENRLLQTREEFSLLFDHAPKDRAIFKDESISALMQCLIDLHINAGPESGSNRVYDDDQIAIEASRQGLKAIVYKSHSIPSFVRAPLVKKYADKWAEENSKKPIDVFGGVVLNYPAGGLNPAIVKVCIDLGGKLVWLPSVNASHYCTVMGRTGGIEVLDENGEVLPDITCYFRDDTRRQPDTRAISPERIRAFCADKKGEGNGVKKNSTEPSAGQCEPCGSRADSPNGGDGCVRRCDLQHLIPQSLSERRYKRYAEAIRAHRF